MEKILETIKASLGIETTDTSFDVEILMHINSIISSLYQLGVGAEGFSADESTTWQELIGEKKINNVKSFMYLKMRMLFDPPQSSFVLEAYSKQAEEIAWRIIVETEPDSNLLV